VLSQQRCQPAVARARQMLPERPLPWERLLLGAESEL
jgi:hypothetical protein